MGFRSTVRADLSAFHHRDLSSAGWGRRVRAFWRGYLDADFRVVYHFRIAQRLVRSRLKPLGLLLYFRQKSRYRVDLSPWAEVGPGLRFQHGFDIVIGPEVRIGSNCTIFNGVTLGNARPDILTHRMPTVGDNCILGTGAKILGAVAIDDDLIIGANVAVRGDVLKGGDYYAELEAARMIRVRRPAQYAD